MGGHGVFCRAGSDCAAAHASRYALFLGLPASAWGSAVYVVIAALALAGLSWRRWLVAFALSVVGLSFSAYLAFFVIGAACGYCVVSTLVAAALVAALGAWRSRPAHRPPSLVARLAALALALAVGTVTVAAVVFAVTAPR
jgi:uncharacterized membrane protein